MTSYAGRLANGADTATRVRQFDTIGMSPNGALVAREGLRPDGGGVVTVNTGTMGVEVTPFSGWVDGGASLEQGGYPFVCDATTALTLDDGDPTLARTDTIVAQVQDNAYDGSGSTAAAVVVVKGTPGAGVPTLPTNSFPLRDVVVPAGMSAGTGGLSSGDLGADRRTYIAALGGVLPVTGATDRDAIASPQPGLTVYRRDTDVMQVYNGTGWDTLKVDEDPAWVNLSLGAGYGAQSGYFVPAYRVFANGRVELRGSVSKNTGTFASGPQTWLTLVSAARPVARATFGIGCGGSGGDVNARLDIETDGTVRLFYTGAAPSFISFDGVAYQPS